MDRLLECRACDSKNLHLFLPLGSHPPANMFLTKEQLKTPEPSFPLNTQACLDCGLIEVADQIPPDFFRHYLYIPSAAATMHTHFAELATVVSKLGPGGTKPSRVVDIGCNDGLFLKFCKDGGLNPLGIDPATNLIELARKNGIEVVNEYFSPKIGKEALAKYGPAPVIVTTNTFNHIGDLHAFMDGIKTFLAPDGAFVIEVPHSLDLVQKAEFDTVYHEHVSEFSVKSLVDLVSVVDMELFDIQRLPVHGGSMRVFIQRKKTGGRAIKPVVAEWLQTERAAKLFDRATYDALAKRVDRNKVTLIKMLRDLKASGKRLAGYGAPAKGNTLLNYFGIGPDLLEFLADRNTLKQGLYSPGMHIPVVAPEKILETMPDYLLILAWNFGDEIMAQQAEYRRRGGKFILPVPDPTIVD